MSQFPRPIFHPRTPSPRVARNLYLSLFGTTFCMFYVQMCMLVAIVVLQHGQLGIKQSPFILMLIIFASRQGYFGIHNELIDHCSTYFMTSWSIKPGQLQQRSKCFWAKPH